MFTPDGKSAGKMDRIMLLALWTKQLINEDVKRANNIEKQTIISVGMGKPTFPISVDVAKSVVEHWSQLWARSQEARRLLKSPKITKSQELTSLQAVVDYGNPQGDIEPREKMARALTHWYGDKVDITPKHLLFTIGGAGALHVIFNVLNQQNPTGKIITPVPYYSLYGAMGREARFHPIPMMQEKGYRLTAHALNSSLEKLFLENKNPDITAFLFCDPNNPLGTFIKEEEWHKIAEILRKFPKIPIILDEAYAEMRMDGEKHVSLLQIAPDLKDRIILMRSATKALSAAGERMALIVDFNEDRMARLLEANINICGHAPRSLQLAFAEAMDKLDETELSQLTDFYRPKIQYVAKRLASMGAAMPDPTYESNGAFYVLADLSDLRGLELPPESKRALGKTGKIKTDEDITYSLLFTDKIMMAPLSYFGLKKELGYMRITCSGAKEELEELMNRLEKRLLEARKIKQKKIESEMYQSFKELMIIEKKLSNTDKNIISDILQTFGQILQRTHEKNSLSAREYKDINITLKKILSDTRLIIAVHSPKKLDEAATKIQAAFRGYRVRKKLTIEQEKITEQWQDFIKRNFKSDHDKSLAQSFFCNLSHLSQIKIASFISQQASLETAKTSMNNKGSDKISFKIKSKL